MRLFFALCSSLVATAVSAQDLAPDALVKKITGEVVAIIKQDQDIRAGNQQKLNALVDAKVVPHFNFSHMTALAVGRNWPNASAEQQKALTSEFRTLLVHTYSSALATYKNQVIEVKPLRVGAGDADAFGEASPSGPRSSSRAPSRPASTTAWRKPPMAGWCMT